MTFDFFNSSRLAFGSKITAAFNQLEKELDSALDNINSIFDDAAVYKDYINKNYVVPQPVRPAMAARVDEIYSVIDEMTVLKSVEFTDDALTIDLTYFNTAASRITKATGSTTIKEGYAFITIPRSNNELNKTIRFSEDSEPERNEILLFEYRVDEKGKVNLKGNLMPVFRFYPQDATQYKSLTRTANVAFPYTATDYECICVVGTTRYIEVFVNGVRIIRGSGSSGYDNRNHAILYLKPGDIVTGSAEFAFKVEYNY